MKQELLGIKLDLKVNWKLSRNEAFYKDNFVVVFSENGLQGEGEVAPNIRYGESPEEIRRQFEALPAFTEPKEVYKFCENEAVANALKCGLVCAAVDLEAKLSNTSIEEVLGVKQSSAVPTSMSVPIMDETLLENYLKEIERFPFIKIKVNEENAESFTKKIASLSKAPLRIDANEGFSSSKSFLRFVEATRNLNIQFMEQPFPANSVEDYLEVRKWGCPFEIMADESIEASADFEELARLFDSVNIKLMKTGGYFRAMSLIKQAREKGLKVMLGCMIESSLGISHALRLAELGDYFDLDGSLLIKNDPYKMLKEKEGRLALR